MDDIKIQQNVLAELDFEPSVDAASIGVSVDEGVVTLSGHVPSYFERKTAERLAMRVKGVRGIVCDIEVRPAGAHRTADDEIAKRVLHVLTWNTSVPDEKLQVKIKSGLVTLSGDVAWKYQKEAAAKAIRGMAGVTGITNAITITPIAKVANVRRHIEEALHRNATLEASNIQIAVSDGRVTLSGHVKHQDEREMAERAAWSAPGVKDVEDRITLDI